MSQLLKHICLKLQGRSLTFCSVCFAYTEQPSLFCVPDPFLYQSFLCGSMCSVCTRVHVSYLGLAKLHCGATPSSVHYNYMTRSLRTLRFTKPDEFSENFQTASDNPPPFNPLICGRLQKPQSQKTSAKGVPPVVLVTNMRYTRLEVCPSLICSRSETWNAECLRAGVGIPAGVSVEV